MILGTSRAVRVFAYPEAVDLRKGLREAALADARGEVLLPTSLEA